MLTLFSVQVLVSYPRSGNSMLRSLLEKVTGVVTGSDTRPDRILSRNLLERGLLVSWGDGLRISRCEASLSFSRLLPRYLIHDR
jgi:hypothetical protein